MSMPSPLTASEPNYAWEVARLFPNQGDWNESDYLSVTHSTNRLVELRRGRIEVLAMPTMSHQLIVAFLVEVLKAFVEPRRLGDLLFAPLRVRIAPKEFREPDVVFMLAQNRDRAGDDYWLGADLVVEVVSKDAESRKRDLKEKRADYAAAGIPEYWIVDQVERRITVLTLAGTEYAVGGEYEPGEQAESKLLAGLTVDVAATFNAAERRR